MSKRIWSIALAYVGVMIGAGVSSGQDLLQYFVSFRAWGLIGVIVLSVLHVGFGRLMISLGSYYRSDDHSVVLAEISHPVIYRILYSGHCSDYHMLSFWFCYDGRCRG